MRKNAIGLILAGACAGAVNGLFGAGGGMVLVPLLSLLPSLDDDEIFPTSVCVILPICLISLAFSQGWQALTVRGVLPYLLGSAAGGLIAGLIGKKIPVVWLHRVLGGLILWGGIRYLC